MEQFFAHENRPIPPSLSSTGRIRVGTKSDLLPCLEQLTGDVAVSPLNNITARIIDEAAVVNIRKPKLVRTFGEYANNDIIPFFKITAS